MYKALKMFLNENLSLLKIRFIYEKFVVYNETKISN